jgi:long-chain acyl-CoA synthetase
MGIPVYNAYGLTEAPLVTMNRWGRNAVGTAGTPLPQTEVAVAPDGEILVRGPQVMQGYDREAPLVAETQILRRTRQLVPGYERNAPLAANGAGWLPTGDLGSLAEAGNLTITGRKKEIIITSYGKNVCPVQAESLLREIPGVSEAMLVGDGRPYCTALLWVGEESLDAASVAELERRIEAVNRRLSPPERGRRWLLLRNELSVAGGELTANLKLRRHVVAGRLAPTLDALYRGARVTAPGVLHAGGVPQCVA